MEEEQQFGIGDVLAIVKRRFLWLLIPALIGPAVGIGLTFLVQPVYTSKAFVLIEQPKVPDKFVTQVVTDQLDTRLMTLQEQILSRSRLEPIIERLGLYDKSNKMSMEEMVERLRRSIDVKMISPEGSSRVPSGFYIKASANSARTAQQVCTEILSMFMSENLKLREQRSEGTTDFLAGQLEESKRKLDQQDAQLAAFKGKYLGQLPTDEQRNLEMLTATRTRLESLNQELSQAQQQKIIQESALSQMSAKLPTTSGAASPSDMQQELTTLQAQLASLQSKYTDDHPDVRKAKAQIQALQSQLKAAAATTTVAHAKDEPVVDTAEMRQMRVALRLTEENIRSKRVEQSHLEQQVQALQSRLQLSPVVEERYKALTRDYETALQFYNDLLSKKTQSQMSTNLERQQEGEQFGVMDAPDLPANPTFPDRLKFGLSGLGAGFALGIAMALLLERRENFLRTEDDVVKILALPVLISIPEVKPAKNIASLPRPIPARMER
jgi:polysaccharide chain length determinant protein (PEP-CTERM system associated)